MKTAKAQRPAAEIDLRIGRQNLLVLLLRLLLLDERRPARAPHDRFITFVTDRPGHDMRYAIDPTRIREELGWRPSVTLKEGLAKTVDWYLQNEDWWRPLLTVAMERRGTGT